jgi:excisionase family DNA binding protein
MVIIAREKELGMPPTLAQEAEELHRALAKKSPTVDVTLSYDTAEFVASLIDARIEGRGVLLTNENQEVTPTEAAVFLGVSRPQVRRIMESGRLPYRMVGTHHRIALRDLKKFKASEHARRKQAMEDYAALQNDLEIFE